MAIEFSVRDFPKHDGKTIKRDYFVFRGQGKKLEGMVEDDIIKAYPKEYAAFKNSSEAPEVEAKVSVEAISAADEPKPKKGKVAKFLGGGDKDIEKESK